MGRAFRGRFVAALNDQSIRIIGASLLAGLFTRFFSGVAFLLLTTTLFGLPDDPVVFGFGGRRTPGRGKPYNEDLQLQRTCPVFVLAMNEDNGSDTLHSWSSSNQYAPRGYLHGAYFDDPVNGLAEYCDSVSLRHFNLDNVDRIHHTIWNRGKTLNSPRSIGGAGYHILSRWCYVTEYKLDNSSIGFGTKHLEISTTTIYWRWEEAFYCPHLVWADPVAPSGFYTDPTSGIEYYLWKLPFNNTVAGIEVEGRSATITPATLDAAVPDHTFIDETLYTFASGSIAIDGASTGTVAAVGTLPANWTIDAATEEIRRFGWTTHDEWGYQIEFDVSADPVGTAYEVVFEAYNKGAAGTEGGSQ